MPPFAGEVADGCVWGRGAVDMKDFDAMVLSVVRARARAGAAPRRPIRLIFTADEEAGSGLGARWLVDKHPEVVEGCTEAIGEVGGFSLTVHDDLRLYLIQTAEKGMAWLNLIADGRAGSRLVPQRRQRRHRTGRGGGPDRDVRVAAQDHRRPAGLPGGGVRGVRHRARPGSGRGDPGAAGQHRPDGRRDDVQHGEPDDAAGRLQAQRHPRPGHRRRSTAGSCPAAEDEFYATIAELLGDKVRYEVVTGQPAVETEFSGALVEAMQSCLAGGGPGRPRGAVPDERRHRRQGVGPGSASAASASRRSGCRRTWTSSSMFHGVDERVPTESLEFGARVLDRFLDQA